MKKNITRPKYMLCALTTQASRHLTSYYDQAMKPFGITAHQMMALAVLSYEDNISLGLFAKRAEIGKAAAVTMIKRLKAMDLVGIRPNPNDARLNSISLTKKAWELIPEIFKSVERLERTFEKTIGGAKVKELATTLKIARKIQIE